MLSMVVSLSTLCAAAAAGGAPDPATDSFCVPESGPPVVWCCTQGHVELSWLAEHLAPILWFSPDEPLAHRGIPRPLPHELFEGCPLLGDPSAPGPTVYWQIDRILTFDRKQTAVATELNGESRGQSPRLPVDGVRSLVLNYFFYYPRDYGLNPHCHDLEGAEFDLDFEREGGRVRVVLARVTGLGHGSALMSNILQVKRRFGVAGEDVRLPVTLLVEEGKHASCPDRNGDGHYTPSYDVNVKVADAWGVRDVFGQGVVTSRYDVGFSKPRVPDDRFGPCPQLFSAGDPYNPYRTERIPLAGGPAQHYVLRRAPRCGVAPIPAQDEAFCEALRSVGHGETGPRGPELVDCEVDGKPGTCLNLRRAALRFHEPTVTFFEPRYHHGTNWWYQWAHFIGPAARFDGREIGMAASGFLPWGLPFGIGGWFSIRGAALYDWSRWRANVDVSYSPSISRLADWYAAAGYDWSLEQRPGEGGGSGRERRGMFSLESGLQVRYRAAWVRVGVRAGISGGDLLSERLVAEVGYGPW